MHHKKVVQQWKNENWVFQELHGDGKDSSLPETILVGLCHGEDGYELLSWAINVAARPGDAIIAFYMNQKSDKVENLIGKLQTETTQGHAAMHTQLKALKDLCEGRKIQMDVKFALSRNEEMELLEEASSALATMLVLSLPGGSFLRNSQRKGNSLAQKAPPGCAVVIVKGYKVLFYKENVCKRSKDNSSTYCDDSHPGTPIRRSMGFGSLKRQFLSTTNSLWGHEEGDKGFDVDSSIVAGRKVWPIYTGEGSPRGVLDGTGLLSESYVSSPSSTNRNLLRSLSQKCLLSHFISHEYANNAVMRSKSQICRSIWRNRSIQRTSTFPPSSHSKKLLGPLDYSYVRNSFKSYVNNLWSTDYSSVRNSFKQYVNNLWGTESMSPNPPTCVDGQQNWRCFFYDELAFATSGFNPANMVGKGGHAEVYKGTLSDGRIVAIKRLRKGGSEEIKEQEFLIELGIIGHVVHPNTTPLVGFCVEDGLHLIFDFSSLGSLATWLHGVNTPVLDWPARYKIAVGTAQGLHYLHTGCRRRIIHRDIKASNILLGPGFEPQISDFGLAKWLPEQCSQLSVFPVEGTFGYLAPEYFMHGIIHEKTDVFAFGVLLLELITGRQPIDSSQQSLVIWAKPLLESLQIEKLVDPRLGGAYDPQEMQTVVLAAGLCVQASATCRPYIGQVLELLTDEHSKSISISFSDSDIFEDLSEEYNTTTYLSDLSRHREIALQF